MELRESIIESHGNSGSLKSRQKTQAMRQWLENYINDHGDYMPHKMEIHLSVGNVKNLHSMYALFCQKHDLKCPHYESMRRMFQSVANCVKLPKTKMFTKCDECIRLGKKIADAKTQTAKNAARIEKGSHLDWQAAERKVYYQHRHLAITCPEEYACVIIDGMDQQKTNVPRFSTRLPKSCDNLEQLGVTIIGSLIHGATPLMHYMPNDFKKDCNVTIQILVNSLKSLATQLVGKKWPHTLFLQLDGAGDNKNKHVMSFLAHLIKEGLFEKVF